MNAMSLFHNRQTLTWVRLIYIWRHNKRKPKWNRSQQYCKHRRQFCIFSSDHNVFTITMISPRCRQLRSCVDSVCYGTYMCVIARHKRNQHVLRRKTVAQNSLKLSGQIQSRIQKPSQSSIVYSAISTNSLWTDRQAITEKVAYASSKKTQTLCLKNQGSIRRWIIYFWQTTTHWRVWWATLIRAAHSTKERVLNASEMRLHSRLIKQKFGGMSGWPKCSAG